VWGPRPDATQTDCNELAPPPTVRKTGQLRARRPTSRTLIAAALCGAPYRCAATQPFPSRSLDGMGVAHGWSRPRRSSYEDPRSDYFARFGSCFGARRMLRCRRGRQPHRIRKGVPIADDEGAAAREAYCRCSEGGAVRSIWCRSRMQPTQPSWMSAAGSKGSREPVVPSAARSSSATRPHCGSRWEHRREPRAEPARRGARRRSHLRVVADRERARRPAQGGGVPRGRRQQAAAWWWSGR
jgi:hypothetical protein